jgi:hypothetical protein
MNLSTNLAVSRFPTFKLLLAPELLNNIRKYGVIKGFSGK